MGESLTIRELMDEQRRRMSSSNPLERFAAVLLIPNELRKRLNSLNDREIGQLLDDEVGARLNVLGPESTICDVAVTRLRRGVNVSREHKRLGIGRGEKRSVTRNAGEHIMHAESSLYRAGIPFLQLPWQVNRFASNTFMVSDVPEAKACLLQAGFIETRRCPHLLIHRQTRKPIRLYADRNSAVQAKH